MKRRQTSNERPKIDRKGYLQHFMYYHYKDRLRLLSILYFYLADMLCLQYVFLVTFIFYSLPQQCSKCIVMTFIPSNFSLKIYFASTQGLSPEISVHKYSEHSDIECWLNIFQEGESRRLFCIVCRDKKHYFLNTLRQIRQKDTLRFVNELFTLPFTSYHCQVIVENFSGVVIEKGQLVKEKH